MDVLLASGAWTLDVAFFAILFLGLLIGVNRGFVRGVCKIAGTILSIFVAFTCCVPLQKALNNWTGATDAINNSTHAPVGDWIMTVVCFLLLVILLKIAVWVIGWFGTGIANATTPTRLINMFLGGLLGALKAFLLIFFLLAITRWIPSEGMHEFISSSTVVGKIYNAPFFLDAVHFKLHIG